MWALILLRRIVSVRSGYFRAPNGHVKLSHSYAELSYQVQFRAFSVRANIWWLGSWFARGWAAEQEVAGQLVYQLWHGYSVSLFRTKYLVFGPIAQYFGLSIVFLGPSIQLERGIGWAGSSWAACGESGSTGQGAACHERRPSPCIEGSPSR